MNVDPDKVAAFLADYCDLCNRHGLYLTPSLYDTLQVWPAHQNDPLERVDDEYLAALKAPAP